MTPSTFTLSPQQAAVINWATSSTGSLNLIARAGCGKTFVAERLCEIIPMHQQVFVGAFNKAIADELASRIVYSNIKCGTFHSLGFSLLRRYLGNIKINTDARKIHALCRAQFKYDRKNAEALARVVSFGKQEGFGIPGVSMDDKELWSKVIDHHDLWDEFKDVSPDRIINVAVTVSEQSLEMCKTGHIDFDDMILAPLAFSDRHYGLYDWVLVDEAQDTNETRRRLISYVLKPGGRVVCVGDPKQSIMGFAGATNEAMELIKGMFNSAELPLTVTRRCPRAVVKVAQEWVPDFEAHPDAIEGSVKEIDTDNVSWLWDGRAHYNPVTDVILCRNTRPLIGISERLRANGVQCMVEGPNGQHLINLAVKWGDDITIKAWRTKVREYQEKEVAKLVKKGDQEDRIERLIEKCGSVKDIAKSVADKYGATTTMLKVAQKIEQMFDYKPKPNEAVLRLCSVHRSKGREWKRVILVGRNRYMPSRYAQQPWQVEQEHNLMYVAVTRAMDTLVDVDVPEARKSQEGDSVEWWEAGFLMADERDSVMGRRDDQEQNWDADEDGGMPF